jgi:hypothetical protein
MEAPYMAMLSLPVVLDHFNHDLFSVESHPHLCLEEGDKSGKVVLILPAVSIEVALDDAIAPLTHGALLTTNTDNVKHFYGSS